MTARLWLCEPLYLPALRATFLQRKAFISVACGDIFLRSDSPVLSTKKLRRISSTQFLKYNLYANTQESEALYSFNHFSIFSGSYFTISAICSDVHPFPESATAVSFAFFNSPSAIPPAQPFAKPPAQPSL